MTKISHYSELYQLTILTALSWTVNMSFCRVRLGC